MGSPKEASPFVEILPPGLICYEILFCLYKRRAATPGRYLTIEQVRSHLGGLEILPVNTIKRAGSAPRAGNNSARVLNAL